MNEKQLLWVGIFLFALFEVWNFLRIDGMSHSNSDTIRPFVIQTFLVCAVVYALVVLKRRRSK